MWANPSEILESKLAVSLRGRGAYGFDGGHKMRFWPVRQIFYAKVDGEKWFVTDLFCCECKQKRSGLKPDNKKYSRAQNMRLYFFTLMIRA